MRSFGKAVTVAVAGALLTAPIAAYAESQPRPDEKSLGAHIDETVEKALESLGRLVEEVPIYEAPEVLPNGDIIIRKRRPDPPETPPGQRSI